MTTMTERTTLTGTNGDDTYALPDTVNYAGGLVITGDGGTDTIIAPRSVVNILTNGNGGGAGMGVFLSNPFNYYSLDAINPHSVRVGLGEFFDDPLIVGGAAR